MALTIQGCWWLCRSSSRRGYYIIQRHLEKFLWITRSKFAVSKGCFPGAWFAFMNSRILLYKCGSIEETIYTVMVIEQVTWCWTWPEKWALNHKGNWARKKTIIHWEPTLNKARCLKMISVIWKTGLWGLFLIPISQMKSLRLRDIKWLAQGHKASKGQR